MGYITKNIEEGDTSIKRVQGPQYQGSLVCLLIFSTAFGLGIASSIYYSQSLLWKQSNCLVLNVGQVSTSQTCNTGAYGLCNYDYQVLWNVTYYNQVADLYLNGSIINDYSDSDIASAATYIHHAGLNYTCYFRQDTFSLSWTIPNSNYDQIGYSAIAFLIASILSVTALVLLCIKAMN
jgi:hypothetical protein